MSETSRAPSGRPVCRIFLSHNSADKPLVKEIADRLELDFGVPHFLDAFAIPAGAAFRPWIDEALAESMGCAIFLGAHGWGPTHLWEAEQALARHEQDAGFRLIPVALPGVREDDMQRLRDGSLFRDMNWADFRNGLDDQDSLDKLYAALTGLEPSKEHGPDRLTPYQIRRDAARWRKSGQRDVSILYRGPQLREAERLAREIPHLAAAGEIAPFLLASAARQRSLWYRVAVAAVTASVIIAGLGVWADHLRRLAEERRALAVSRQLALESRAVATPATSLLLAAQAVSEVATPEASGNLLARLQAWPSLERVLHPRIGPLTTVAMASDGATIMLGSRNGTVLRWSARTLLPKGSPLLASTGLVSSLAFVPRSEEVLAGYEDGRVLAWTAAGPRAPVSGIPSGFDLRDIAPVNSLALGPAIDAIAMAPDGHLAAAGTHDGHLFLIDRANRRAHGPSLSIGEPRVNVLDFDPDTGTLAIGGGLGGVLLMDPGRKTLRKLAEMDEILAVRFLADGALVAVDTVGHGRIWKRSGAELRPSGSFKGPDFLTAAAVSRDGLVAFGDGRGMLHTLELGAEASPFTSIQAHDGPINGLAFSPGGDRVVAVGADGTATVWNLRAPSVLASPLGRLAPDVKALRATPEGTVVAALSTAGAAAIWRWSNRTWTVAADLLAETLALVGEDRFAEAATPASDGFLAVPDPEIALLDLDQRGGRVAWATRDGALLWRPLANLGQSRLLWDGSQHGGVTLDVLRLSDSGRFLLAAAANGEAMLFDLTRLTSRHLCTKDRPCRARSAGFDHAERRLAIGQEDGQVSLWEVADGRLTNAQRIHTAPVDNVTFTPEGTRLLSHAVVGDGNETALTLSPVPALSPSRPLVTPASDSPPAILVVNQEAGLVAAADRGGQVHLWDLESLRPIATLKTGDHHLPAMAFDAQGRQLIVADGEGQVSSWGMGVSRWRAAACAIANRWLSEQEWDDFVPGQPYAPACRDDLKDSSRQRSWAGHPGSG